MTSSYLDSQLYEFLDLVASRHPAPGGGSVTAVTVSMAAGLVVMAARSSERQLTVSGQIATDAERVQCRAGELVDVDARAYGAVLATDAATRDSDPGDRREQLRAALETAALVPLEVAELGAETVRLAVVVTCRGNSNLRGDAATAALLAEAAVRSAAHLVGVNVRRGGCDPDLVRRAQRCNDVAANALRGLHEVPEQPR